MQQSINDAKKLSSAVESFLPKFVADSARLSRRPRPRSRRRPPDQAWLWTRRGRLPSPDGKGRPRLQQGSIEEGVPGPASWTWQSPWSRSRRRPVEVVPVKAPDAMRLPTSLYRSRAPPRPPPAFPRQAGRAGAQHGAGEAAAQAWRPTAAARSRRRRSAPARRGPRAPSSSRRRRDSVPEPMVSRRTWWTARGAGDGAARLPAPAISARPLSLLQTRPRALRDDPPAPTAAPVPRNPGRRRSRPAQPAQSLMRGGMGVAAADSPAADRWAPVKPEKPLPYCGRRPTRPSSATRRSLEPEPRPWRPRPRGRAW